MALIPESLDLSLLPPELIRSVAEDAASDADRAAFFLSEVGLALLPGQARRLPAHFLLDLGAAMRLLIWEQAGLTIHLEAGLPCAREATLQVFREALPEAGGSTSWLAQAVFRLSVDRLAWSGRRDLDADILLDMPDEDALVEVMARFLWANRHADLETARGVKP